MRIKRLTVKNFGRFENYAVDFNGNLAVINGQNEAGKSTIFDMIKILLFGLGEDVSSEERMSYVRYGANEAHISGEFERADGSLMTLSRIISKHSSDLNVNEDFDFQNLGSVKAPIAADLSKEVYENIYALDFHAMSAIKDDIWQGIKDEFMGADMAKELVSANDAIDTASERAEELFKDNNAPSVINDLLKERDGLKERLTDINTAQKAAAQDYLSLDKTKREITEMQNKIEFENSFVQEAAKMNGLKDDVAKIKSLAADAGDLSAYKKWLPNIKEEYAALKSNEESARAKIQEAQAAKQAQVQAEKVEKTMPEMPEKYRRVLERENDIAALRIEKEPESFVSESIEETTDEPNTAVIEWENLKREVLFEGAQDDEVNKSLDQINTMSLAEKLSLFAQSRDNVTSIINDASRPKKSGVRLFFYIFSLFMSIAMVLSGALIFGFVFLEDKIAEFLTNVFNSDGVFLALKSFVDWFNIVPLKIEITADLLCGIGLILLIVAIAFIKGKSVKAQLKNRDEVIQSAKAESQYNRAEFEKQLFGLPINKIRIKKADITITDDIIKLKEARQKLYEANNIQKDIQVIEPVPEPEKDIESIEEIRRLASALLDTIYPEPEDNLFELKHLLEEAKEFEAKLAHLEENFEPQDDEKPAVTDEEMSELIWQHQNAHKELSELQDVLGENPDEQVEAIQEKYVKLNRAVVLRDEILEKYPNFKEVSERMNQLIQAGWPYSDEAVSAANERIDELRRDIGEAQSKIGVMENSVKKALLGHDPAELASQILKLDDKILDYKMEYDKLRLSEVIIQQGHNTFTKLHQPEVLQRASYYLSILTDGKYSELDLDGETSEIIVMLPDGRYMTPQGARLSQATREQIYLSIRLSVIESFDEGREPMPIALDEALITWDTDRLTSGLNLLAQLARKRQVLIFTCHDFIVDSMKQNQPTAQIIDLK